MDLVEDPENPNIARLLEVCYQSHLATHRAIAKAGAHLTSLGDSLGGPDVCSPAIFNRFARPYEERLVRDLAADGIFVVIHICGDTRRILPALSEYDSCGFELDHKTDVLKAKNTVGIRHVLFGNMDPSGVIALGSPAQVREATRRLISDWKPSGRFILNSGCAIPPTTPPENIRALIDTAKDCGVYD
jgi:uroporphyrinogen-III decarboxylase